MTPEIIGGIHALAAFGLEGADFHSALAAGDDQTGLGQAQDLAGLTLALHNGGGMDLELLALQFHGGNGPGMEAPNLVVHLLSGLVPVDGAHGLIQHGSEADAGRILGSSGDGALGKSGEGTAQQISAQHMVREMDAGDVIDVAKTCIGENETAGELLDRLAVLGADLLSSVLKRAASGDECCGCKQCPDDVTFAPMLDKSMCPIDWNKTAQQVHNHVRGLHPWPVATMELQGQKFKVHATRIVEGNGNPGQILGLTKTGLVIACGEGAVEIQQLQAEGGKRMAAPDYFRGHPLNL